VTAPITERRFVLWFVRRWANSHSWQLHVTWRSRAIQAEAAVRQLNEELNREKELRRDADKRADFHARNAAGKTAKVERFGRLLDCERTVNAAIERRAERYRLAWLSARRRANSIEAAVDMLGRASRARRMEHEQVTR